MYLDKQTTKSKHRSVSLDTLPKSIEDLRSCSAAQLISKPKLPQGDLSELYCLVYVLGCTHALQDLLNDDEFITVINCPSVDSNLELLSRLLSQRFWESGSPDIVVPMVERILSQYQRSYQKYSQMDRKALFLGIIEDIITKYCKRFHQPIEMQIEELGSIYSTFTRLGALSSLRTIYLAQLTTDYKTRTVLVLSDSVTEHRLHLYSNLGFNDVRLSDLCMMVRRHAEELDDVFVFDESGKQLKNFDQRVRDLDTRLVFSPLVTNLEASHRVRTFRFVIKKLPSVYFHLSCQDGYIDESVRHHIKRKISSLLSNKTFAAFTIEFDKAFKFPTAQPELGLQEKINYFMLVTCADSDSIITLTLDIEGLDPDKTLYKSPKQTVDLWQPKLPQDLIHDHYLQNIRKIPNPSPTDSAHILILEYPDNFAVNQDLLCKDIKSELLDADKFVYYKLKSVVIKPFGPDNRFLPILRVDNRDEQTTRWFSPSHGCSFNLLDGLDHFKYFVYERCTDNF